MQKRLDFNGVAPPTSGVSDETRVKGLGEDVSPPRAMLSLE